MNQLIAKTYEPGTSAQLTRRYNAYQAYAVQQLPVIWLPWLAGFNETAKSIHGVNATFNPILDLTSPNYWTITQ